MKIQTSRLLIRRWTLEDAPAAFAIYGDPQVARYIGGKYDADEGETREKLGRLIERDRESDRGFFAVELDGRVVGGALLKPAPDREDIEVGYHLHRQVWGQGLATEIAGAMVAYGFEQLELPRIAAFTDPDNYASQHVLLKTGLKRLGDSTYLDDPAVEFGVERNNWQL